MIAAGPIIVAEVVPYQEDVIHVEGGLGAGLHEQEPILLRVRAGLIVLDWKKVSISISNFTITKQHYFSLLTYPVCC